MIGTRIVLSVLAGLAWANMAYAAPEKPKTSTERHGDWSVVCVEKEKGKVCNAQANIVNAKDGKTVVQLSAGKSGKNKKSSVFQINVPLVVDLSKGVSVSIDGKNKKKMDYIFCAQQGCFASVDMLKDKSFLRSLKAGSKMELSFNSLVLGEVKGQASLKGFSKAYRRAMK